MTRKRAAVALGAVGLAASVIGGAGTAYAWAPGSVKLSGTCLDQPGTIRLTVTNNDSHGGDFTLSNDKTADTVRGSVKGHSTADETVPYAGAGTTWTIAFDNVDDVHSTYTTVAAPTCMPATPTPTPTPTKSESPSPTPSVTASVTPSHPATRTPTPSATPSHSAPASPSSAAAVLPNASASTGGKSLAFTGGGSDSGLLAGAGAALLLAGGGVVYRTRRARHR
ncbi:hypothetical protein [Kitasatospora sp. LaBMicrA B282]|uniref:hypothetical protein n=1 Tax=Kitasatospora sp. LaBMicrA B282 TaxID=3420949 RepID=UPI003D0AFA2A